ADSRLLEATECDREICAESVVPYRAGPQPASNGIGALRIVGEYRTVETIDRRIGDLDGLFLVCRRNDAQHRAEDFLPRDGHVVVYIAEHGRLDEIAAVEVRRASAACRQPRAFGLALLDVVLHPVPLARHRERA